MNRYKVKVKVYADYGDLISGDELKEVWIECDNILEAGDKIEIVEVE